MVVSFSPRARLVSLTTRLNVSISRAVRQSDSRVLQLQIPGAVSVASLWRVRRRCSLRRTLPTAFTPWSFASG